MSCLRFMVAVLGLGSLLCSHQAQAGKNVQCCHVDTANILSHTGSVCLTSMMEVVPRKADVLRTCEKRNHGAPKLDRLCEGKPQVQHTDITRWWLWSDKWWSEISKRWSGWKCRIQVLHDRCIYCNMEVVFPQSTVIEGIIWAAVRKDFDFWQLVFADVTVSSVVQQRWRNSSSMPQHLLNSTLIICFG